MPLFNELKRRNVIKVAIAYIIIAWLLMQIGDTLSPALLLPGWTNSALAFFLILGFPLALFFAWAYELTPEGIKKEKDVDRSESITFATSRKLDFFIIGLLVLALGYVMYDRFTPSVEQDLPAKSGISAGPDKSIAVLAFVNMSNDPDQEYFSDGISEELLNLLSKTPDLRVISRTSAFYFKGKNATVADIARELGVGFVVEGSVRKAGNQIRITAQLIEAKTDAPLWSETYDRELENIFDVQDEISAAIAVSLKDKIGLQVEAVPQAIRLVNSDAHDAYLRGRHLLVKRTGDSIRGAVKEFEDAIELYPDYALAHADLAIANLLLTRESGGYGDLSHNEALVRAEPHADLAMKLAPSLAEAQAAKGFVLKRQRQHEQALTHYRKAIEINPSYSGAYTWMGWLLLREIGDYVQATAAREQALRVDPLSRPAINNYLAILTLSDRKAEARKELEKIASIYPDIYTAWQGNISAINGQWSIRALALLNSMTFDNRLSRSNRNALMSTLAYMGLEEEALALFASPPSSLFRILGRLEEAVIAADERVAEDPTALNAFLSLGQALAGIGDYARARPVLEKLWQESGGRITASGLFRISSATALIVIRREMGADVEELLMAVDDHVHRLRSAGFNRRAYYEKGFGAFLAGDRDRGLALIAGAVNDGRFIRPKNAYLHTLYEDPGFAPIQKMQEDRAITEREKFLTVVCNDNPYKIFWQPAQGTCERF